MRGKQSLELSANRQGVEFKVLQGLKVQDKNAGGQLVEKEFAKWGIDVSSAICRLSREAADRERPIARILWVDPHPGNNIGLQYAFGQLGILVVAINDETQTDEAFRTAGDFDGVITHMGEDFAGLRTVEAIRANYPLTPVIIYSGSYGRKFEKEHPRGERLDAPVVLVTYCTIDVFHKVVDIAAIANQPLATSGPSKS